MRTRLRRGLGVALVLVVAAVVVGAYYDKLGGPAPPALPADAPPQGVPVFYVRDPGNPHRLIAHDWTGARRGFVTLPTWVPVSRLRQAPDGSGFMLDPLSPGDYAAYFDRAGRTLFETNDESFVSQAWSNDSSRVCVWAYLGSSYAMITRTPAGHDRVVPTALDGDFEVATCNVATDMMVLKSVDTIAVLELSNGTVIGGGPSSSLYPEPRPIAVSADAAYTATGSTSPYSDHGQIRKLGDVPNFPGTFDSGLLPVAFSGDDSLLLVLSGTSLEALEWRSRHVAWTYDPGPAVIDRMLARPDGREFVLYQSDAAVLIHDDGHTTRFD